ncbi:LysR substrate-binding domain-containing protein [Achromobacter seleniivolatilans]|uniref:LysR substrate-binding domain-containing protein n=1 Tax=Achromobacter seleniivolatilans TaxID=3047478 RepID=A0ABY9M5N9_9BURK|nr:LysR substrate-binding domain-containing protein [Achromobacter sp. R39]WMD21508.1 LysR substrate-binding domain-containing protein [Achromobacter sp. R39]
MKLQQVFDFLAVTQHGSVHAAARATGQTQPAMTKSLRRLERTLGLPLFERHAKGMRPNDFGMRFLPHAQHLVHEAKRAREAMSQMRGERMGSVSYGISPAAAALLAPPALQRFRLMYPEVQLDTCSGGYATLAPQLRDGELDFAICPLPPGQTDPQLQMRELMNGPMVMLARQDHPLRKTQSLEDLRDVVFAVVGPPGQPGAAVYDVFEDAGLGTPRVDMQADSPSDAAALVAESDRMALLPAVVLATAAPHQRLAVVPITDPLPNFLIGLFHRASGALTPAAQALATQFEHEAAFLRCTPS